MDEAARFNAQPEEFADNAVARVSRVHPRYERRQQMLKVSRSVAERAKAINPRILVCKLRTCAVDGRSRVV
ncbi:hypothetical protein ACSG4H_002791 [Cronobacter turicensis]